VHDFLTNPVYAGAFVYGRTREEKRVVDGRIRPSERENAARRVGRLPARASSRLCLLGGVPGHARAAEGEPAPGRRGRRRLWGAETLSTPDAGEPRPGKRNELLVKAYLPYKVNFGLEVVEAERPVGILSRLFKDFDGSGEWTLRETADGTEATLDWRPSVNHALIRYPTPVLRPLFRSNHNWAMRRGERQLGDYLKTHR
jgi:hypothetical protein